MIKKQVWWKYVIIRNLFSNIRKSISNIKNSFSNVTKWFLIFKVISDIKKSVLYFFLHKKRNFWYKNAAYCLHWLAIIATCWIFICDAYIYDFQTLDSGFSGTARQTNQVWQQDKKEEIWPSHMTKAPTPTEMSKGQGDNTNNATKKFD